MQRVLFEIPGTPFKLHGFGLMLGVAFFAAIFLADWRARRSKLNPDWIYDLAFWVLVGSLTGARGLYVWQYWGKSIHDWREVFAIWEGGIVLYGGVLGGLAAGLFRAYRLKIPILATCDAIAPSIALGLAIGRIGCFLNGCCYGDPCQLPWAVSFPNESSPWYQQVREGLTIFPATTARPPWTHYLATLDESGNIDRLFRDTQSRADAPAPPRTERRAFEDPATKELTELDTRVLTISARSLPVHPTQLYSSIDGLILLALLSAYYPLRRRDGEVAALLLLTYPVTRFLIEQLRGDEGSFLLGMTISQVVSLAMGVVGLCFWAFLRSHPQPLYAETAAETETPASAADAVTAQASG